MSSGYNSVIELPPSPNWYQSAICSSSSACGGLLACGAKDCVLLLTFGTTADEGGNARPDGRPRQAGQCARIVGSLAGHSDRVSGVAFVADPTCKELAHLLVSVGNDGAVRLWDARPEVMLGLGKLGSHDKAATAVACSPCAGASDVVLSAGRDGTLRVWSIKGKAMRSCWRPLTATGGPVWPCAVALSPASASTAAVGYQSGVVLVVDIDASVILQKLAGHEEQIQCLAFQPHPSGVVGKPAKGATLVSSSKDRTMRLWGAQTVSEEAQEDADLQQWCCEEILVVPKPTSGALTPQQKSRLWIACCWAFHSEMGWVLCTTGYVGDVHVWAAQEKNQKSVAAGSTKGKGLQPLAITGGHSRPIFGICSLPTPTTGAEEVAAQSASTESNWLLTVSMDRSIGCWDIDKRRCRWTMPSLGGFVYRIKFAPTDPNRMAVAVGDKSIRVWRRSKLPVVGSLNIDEATEQVVSQQGPDFDVSFLWKGVREKVTALCWHPTDETKLAFGLDDGAVGVYTLAGGAGADGHVHKMFGGQHSGTVFVLAWPAAVDSTDAGRSSDMQQDPPLYSAGADGRVYQWNKKKVVDVDSLILGGHGRLQEGAKGGTQARKSQRSCIAFSADSRKVAVGNSDGSIEVYLTDQPFSLDSGSKKTGWRLIRVYHEHSALVYTMAWGSLNADWPEERDWLASGSEDCTIRVHDTGHAARLSLVTGEDDSANSFRRAAPIETDRLALLCGHTRAVTEVAWSPHTKGLLASSCLDGTAQVWTVTSKQCAVANMREHAGRVLCIAWSPLDPDILYSGADDQTVRRWDMLSQVHTSPPARKSGKRTPSNPTSLNSPSAPPDAAPTGSISGGTRQRKPRVKRKPKGILPDLVDVENSDDNSQNSCANLASHIFERQAQSSQADAQPHIPTRDHLLFGGIDSAIDTVDTAISALNDSCSNTVDSGATLEMWRGNIGAALNLVTSSRGLGDKNSASSDLSTWTALSVLAGRDVWKSMMEVQGQALISRGDIHNGVLHLLAAEQAEAAVGAYREAGMFHEAITLAKLRLGDDDKIVTELYVDYATSLEKKRDFTTATKCYLAAGLPQKAVQTLIRRGDLDAFKQAYEISCLTEEGGDHSLAALCGCQCQALGEWDAASSYYLRHDELVAYVVFLSTEEAFRSEVSAMGWYEHVESSWKRYRMKQVTVPAFRATVWTYDPRLQTPLGQALLQLAEHTLSVTAGEVGKESRHTLSQLTSGSPGISESDACRFAEIIESQPAT